jgi:hypothetical protein
VGVEGLGVGTGLDRLERDDGLLSASKRSHKCAS